MIQVTSSSANFADNNTITAHAHTGITAWGWKQINYVISHDANCLGVKNNVIPVCQSEIPITRNLYKENSRHQLLNWSTLLHEYSMWKLIFFLYVGAISYHWGKEAGRWQLAACCEGLLWERCGADKHTEGIEQSILGWNALFQF